MGQVMNEEALEDTDSGNASCSRVTTLVLSQDEKLLSTVARWATYAPMKVSQSCFADPMFVVMHQAACGPPKTHGLVPTLTTAKLRGYVEE